MISGAAALVLAEILPADILAKAKRDCSWRTAANYQQETSTEEWKRSRRKDMIAEWQRRWEKEIESVAWTRRILPNIGRWLERMPELAVSYHLI